MLCVTLTGCSSVITGTKDAICNTWLPISVSRKDVLTPRTKEEIAANNAAAEKWCGERPIAKEPPAKIASN